MFKQKLLSLFVALIATTALWASNTITYTSTSKLTRSSLNVGKTTFGPAITSHTFSNGTGTITCSGEITTIGSDAFYDCSGLTSIDIPNSVTTIGDGAFAYCSGLTSVTIPNSVTTIGESAFEYCSGLTSIDIPNSVTTIGKWAFYSCRGLTKTNYTGTIADWCKIKFGNYTVNPMCYSHNFYINDVEVKDLVIPNGVDTIGDYAFYNCFGLTSVTIPNSVSWIGREAFYGCSGLTSIDIPNSVTTIGVSAFAYCSGLTSVTIPNSVTTIGQSAFHFVNNIIYSGTATGSPWGAKCMDGYVEGYLVYSDATKTTLCGCSSAATGAITIPNSVTTIGEYAFYECYGLTSVTIPNSVTTIGDEAFYGCRGLTSVTIPSSVTTIGYRAFYECSGLTSVTIPNSVTTIGNCAFGYCSGLTSITIPNSVTKIGSLAFYECSGLTSVTIPNSVTTIGDRAFYDCSGLTSVTCYATTPPTCGSDCFYCKTSIPVYVPAGSIDAYKQATGWKYFTNILPISAEETPITGDQVIVTPSTNNATFTWPQNDRAAGYSIEITKDGVVFCTLKFNAQGQLTGIAFAPGRDGAREMASAEMTANGWQFTVTGLSQASKYGYTLDALNASQQSIKHYQGEFYTDGYTALDQFTDSPIDRFTKIIKNNRLFILHNGKIYNAAGIRMR